jgi:hypothetical protein
VDEMFPYEERTIMKADRVKVGLQPERNLGKDFAWGMLPFGQYLQRHFLIKDMRASQVAKYTQDGKQAEFGDIGDITQKLVIAQPLTLTNKNLILAYRKGLMNKRNLVIAIPMEWAKSVQEKGLPHRHLEIRFEVPRKEENTKNFDIYIFGLKDRQAWQDKLNQLIAEYPTSDRLPPLR